MRSLINSSAPIGGKFICKKNPVQDLLSSLNAVISTYERTKIIQGHVIFKIYHNQIYQLKITINTFLNSWRLIIFSVTNNLPRLFHIDHLNKSHFLDKKLHQSFIIWQVTAVTTIPFTLLILLNCKIIYHLKTSIQINGNINFTSKINGLRVHTR